MGWKTYDDKSWKGEIGILTPKNDLSVDKIYDKPIIKLIRNLINMYVLSMDDGSKS